MDAVVKPLENLYAQAPALPATWKETLVKVAPWLALIFGVLSVLVGLMGVLGAGALTAVAPLAGRAGAPAVAWVWLGVVLLFVEGVLLLMAYSPLKRRALKGWNILFLLLLVGLVGSVVVDLLSFNVMGIVVSLLVAAIEAYVLFQVKPLYK